MRSKPLVLIFAMGSLAMTTNAVAYTDSDGTIYGTTGLSESLGVSPQGPATVETVNQYDGFVELRVVGSFDPFGDEINPNLGQQDALYWWNYPPNYGNNFESSPDFFFGTADGNNPPAVPYDGIYPAFNLSHDYTYVVNTGIATPSNFYFGVGDSIYWDNTGGFNVTITQLVPEPSSLALLGASVASLICWRKKSREQS